MMSSLGRYFSRSLFKANIVGQGRRMPGENWRTRLTLEALEDRITPADPTFLSPPGSGYLTQELSSLILGNNLNPEGTGNTTVSVNWGSGFLSFIYQDRLNGVYSGTFEQNWVGGNFRFDFSDDPAVGRQWSTAFGHTWAAGSFSGTLGSDGSWSGTVTESWAGGWFQLTGSNNNWSGAVASTWEGGSLGINFSKNDGWSGVFGHSWQNGSFGVGFTRDAQGNYSASINGWFRW